MMPYIKNDLKRYFKGEKGILPKIKIILLTQGIWATVIYRAGSWCFVHKKNIFIRPLLPFLTVSSKFIEILTGISISFKAKIGKGLYIGHYGNIIVNAETIMGENCNNSQGITIWQSACGGKQQTPEIGDRLYICPGAKIIWGHQNR